MADTNTTIPTSVTDRELLASLISESVGYLITIDKIKSNLKEVREVTTDKEGKLALSATYFNSLVKAAYDSSKIRRQIQELQESLDDLSVLRLPTEDEDDQDEQ
jgi:hypothetical protein